jgi:hypothetical protein
MKSRTLLWCLATGLGGLGLGLIISLTFGPGNSSAVSVHALPGPPSYPFEIMAAGAHSHQQEEVPKGEPAPSLQLEVLYETDITFQVTGNMSRGMLSRYVSEWMTVAAILHCMDADHLDDFTT